MNKEEVRAFLHHWCELYCGYIFDATNEERFNALFEEEWKVSGQ